MQIRVYIDPNGDVTITTLFAELVPVAFSLDHTDQHLHHWLDALPMIETGGHSEVKQRELHSVTEADRLPAS